MRVQEYQKSPLKVITGNAAAAYGAMLCRPKVIASYPITPQSEVVEALSRFQSNGQLDAEMVEVEGENSALNIVTAASMCGVRVFTASSSWGLAYMYDALLQAAGFRAPIVMVNVNREMPGILAVSCGQQDMIATRDSGWIQLVVENCQEILDTIITAYRLAEDYDIQVPVMLNYDGFYLSFSAEPVSIPAIADVDKFLHPLSKQPPRMALVPGKPVGCGSHGILKEFMELRYKHCAAMERAKAKYDDIDREFRTHFGRSYCGQIEEYQTNDAEIVLVTSGTAAGTARSVIDAQRERGLKVGLVKIRMFRPFPRERLTQVLKGKKAIGVLDRSVAFGWNRGPMFVELKALHDQIGSATPILSFIDGLASLDITTRNIEFMIQNIETASQGKKFQEITWVPLEI